MINMINPWLQKFSIRSRSAIAPFAIVAMWAVNGAYPGFAEQSATPTFPSAAAASESLFQAVRSNNAEAIANILGGSSELASSRDDEEDKVDRELFVQKYKEMHRLGRDPDGSVTLYIGAENWPFPIPMVAENGAWRFDPEAGEKEVVFRRIGDNELTVMAVCHDFITAEKRYRASPNGANPAEISPVSLVAKAATESANGDAVLFNGYYFRVFSRRQMNGTSPGTGVPRTPGFALIAYPAEYRSSGVMTFVVTENGVVYEKDLGPDTSRLAIAMTAFHKDLTWHVADE
jgi:hypothetical protein